MCSGMRGKMQTKVVVVMRHPMVLKGEQWKAEKVKAAEYRLGDGEEKGAQKVDRLVFEVEPCPQLHTSLD